MPRPRNIHRERAAAKAPPRPPGCPQVRSGDPRGGSEPPKAIPTPPMRWGSKRGGGCGMAPSTSRGWLEPADPDVGNARNGHTSDGDDDDAQSEPKTDGHNQRRRRDAGGGETRPRGRQEAGRRAAVGGMSHAACREVPRIAHMRRGGLTMVGSSSGPLHFSLIYFAFFNVFYLHLMYFISFIYSSHHTEQDTQKKRRETAQK
jgi:hypothetical protein